MYENEELSPEERNKVWADLEKKYRTYIDFDNLPFYSRGAGWQRQLHIYLYPLYYIDYCMAQTVAFEFWLLSMKDRNLAWKKYMKFVDLGGTKTFEDLVKSVDFKLPYEKGCIKEIAKEISTWIDTHQI
jgi:oligoendopeptidase F